MLKSISTLFSSLILLTASFAFGLEPIPGPANGMPGAANGSISGSLGYPSDEVPALQVVAFAAGDFKKFYKTEVPKAQSSFTIQQVPPGSYVVVAYTLDSPMRGGYSKAVACGLEAKCTDHSLVPVKVEAGKTAGGVELKDWYAPENAFPPRP